MNNKVSLYVIIVGILLGVGLLKVDTGLAQTYNKYNFKYTYLTGDSYTGSVYCAPSYNYSPGKTIAHYTAGKQDGSYQILTGEYDAGYASLYGNVCINSFYDTQNKATYKPLDTKIVTGTQLPGK